MLFSSETRRFAAHGSLPAPRCASPIAGSSCERVAIVHRYAAVIVARSWRPAGSGRPRVGETTAAFRARIEPTRTGHMTPSRAGSKNYLGGYHARTCGD